MKKAGMSLLVYSLALVALLTACEDKGAVKDQRKPAVLVQSYTAKEAKIGDPVACPVYSTVFKVTDKSLSVRVKDKTYYVCCEDCVQPLTDTPDKYLGEKKSAVEKPAVKTPKKHDHTHGDHQ